MKTRRTDLALEAKELWQESADGLTRLPGVIARDHDRGGIPVTVVEVTSKEGAQALGKPIGHYITLTLTDPSYQHPDAFSQAVRVIAGELSTLLPPAPLHAPILVAGLGNRFITPDAIGPQVHRHILVTRHLVEQLPDMFGSFRPVASLCAEVLGNTGVESGEVVSSVCQTLHPVCVIAVDALASRSLSRLCSTIQITDTGITPGSGVGNHRYALTKEHLGVPVIALGVPTVVDAATLAADLTGTDIPPKEGKDLFVTPRDIDQKVAHLSKLIAYGINLALHPDMTLEELELLLG